MFGKKKKKLILKSQRIIYLLIKIKKIVKKSNLLTFFTNIYKI